MYSTKSLFSHLDKDLPAGLVVFLVALPLCLGIAVGCQVDAIAGLIAGIVGGLVVASFSGSPLAVSGPAAGLITIVLNGVETMGSFQAFTATIVLAGLIQFVMGFLNGGIVAYYIPNSIIKGMLAAIGLTLILKQIPHFLGVDADIFGDIKFWQKDGRNTFSEIWYAIFHIDNGPAIVGAVSLAILIAWDRIKKSGPKLLKFIPGPLLVVVFGVLINKLFAVVSPNLVIKEEHLVALPKFGSVADVGAAVKPPAFSTELFLNPDFWVIGFTIALVASLETLLSIEATDKLDPHKRTTPTNKELRAQGIGNMVSGLLGGLPITAVIVRSTANISSDAQSKLSALVHGLLLLISVLFLAPVMNEIPLAALAAVLLVVGFKLTKPALYKSMFKLSVDQWLPFIATIVAVLLTDLLVGIGIGVGVAIFQIMLVNLRNPYIFNISEKENTHVLQLKLSQQTTFLNKAAVAKTLEKVPNGSRVEIDGTDSHFISHDVLEVIYDFIASTKDRAIEVKMTSMPQLEEDTPHIK